jgi:hypothetical protein
MHQNYVSHMEPPGSGATPASGAPTLMTAFGAVVLHVALALPPLLILKELLTPSARTSFPVLILELLAFALTGVVLMACSVRLVLGIRLGMRRAGYILIASAFGSIAAPMLLIRRYGEQAYAAKQAAES